MCVSTVHARTPLASVALKQHPERNDANVPNQYVLDKTCDDADGAWVVMTARLYQIAAQWKFMIANYVLSINFRYYHSRSDYIPAACVVVRGNLCSSDNYCYYYFVLPSCHRNKSSNISRLLLYASHHHRNLHIENDVDMHCGSVACRLYDKHHFNHIKNRTVTMYNVGGDVCLTKLLSYY